VEFRPALVIGHVSNVVFDASTFEIWGALLNGCRLAVIPKLNMLAPEVLRDQLKDLGVSTMFLTTALFQECVRSNPGIFAGMDQVPVRGRGLRCGMYTPGGGGGRTARSGARVRTDGDHDVCLVFCGKEGRAAQRAVRSGAPIGNTQNVDLVDREMEVVGIVLPGEICVGGLGVARGYGNQAEMTAERFVRIRSARRGGEAAIYRPETWGEWRKEGMIEFVGGGTSR